MADHGHPPSSSHHHTGHGNNSSQHSRLEYDSFQSRPTIEDSYQQHQPQSSHYQHPHPHPSHAESARAYSHEPTSQSQRYPVSYQQQHSQHPPVPTTYPSHASTSTSSSSSKSFASYLPPRLDFGGANHQHHSYDSSSSSSQGPSSHPPPALPYHQVPETTADQAPKPYKGKTTPFPIPVGKRSLGGLAGLEEQYGGAIPKGLYGISPQPAALGKTRCYWALLSTEPKGDQCDPTFLYCDPILQNHLATEAEYLVGESFLEFVHPAEKEQARKDLESVIKNGGLFGSVVRCRYYRVPSIRTHLGCKNAPKAPGEHFFAADERYLPIDMVMNMVGDRMALCFFHAVINKSQQDNDESNKSDWTNWCGTPRELFNLEQCNKVWSSVISNQPAPRDDLASPPQVFQILSMPAGNGEPEIIFSWPPPRFYANEVQEQQQSGQLFSAGSRLANHDDGSYFADEFAKLAQSVRTSPSGRTESGETARNGEPGTIQDGRNTSCTRRFRSKHTLTTHGMLRSIETVLIPYGTVMLACYNTTYVQTMSRNHASSFGSDFGTPSSQGRDMAIPQQVNYQSPSASSTNKRIKAEAHLVHPDSPAWPSANSAASSSSAPVSAVQEYSGSPASDHHAWPNSATTGRFRHGSVSTATSQNRMDSISPETSHAPHLPAGKRKSTAEMATSNGAAASQSHEMPSPLSIGRNRNDSLGASSFEGGGSLGSNSAGPSAGGGSGGEKRCTSCGTANSPEWRKGPTGQKTLCNACGLRFSRSVTRQQKNEEKARGTATTTSSASTSHSNNGPRSLANKATPAGLVSSGGYKPPIAPYYPGSQMPARRDPGSDQPPPSGGYGGYTAMQIHSMGWGSPPRGDGSGNHHQHKQ